MIYLTITEKNNGELVESIKVAEPVMIGKRLFRIGDSEIKALTPSEAINIFTLVKVNEYTK